MPLPRLREGFVFDGQRVSFGSFQRGIHRGRDQRGPAALTLTTSFNDPYADTFDEAGALFTYAYRTGSIDQPDNRALRAAFELQTPLVYFRARVTAACRSGRSGSAAGTPQLCRRAAGRANRAHQPQ